MLLIDEVMAQRKALEQRISALEGRPACVL